MKFLITTAAISFAAVLIAASAPDNVESSDTSSRSEPAASDSAIAVAPPPFSEGIFPCSRCHREFKPDRQVRKLRWAHENISLKHDEENRWCLDCHDAENRDKLHLAGGQLIDFSESYRLCGQCHGPKLRDWKAGVHGKRTGNWYGKKTYLLCAGCHDPHSPAFKPIRPLPPPKSPAQIGAEKK